MGDFFLTSMSDSSNPIPIYPEWGFKGGREQIQSSHRTQAGRLFTYQWGSYFKYSVPLRFVSSSDQSRIGAWWQNQHQIAFTLDSSLTESTFLCRITNDDEPFPTLMAPYRDLVQGELQLESLNHEGPTARPFVLDDDVFGLLDQPYNALIG